MGKRAKKVTLKKMAKPKLETVFSCPLCSHEKCIECRMDRAKQIGTAQCRVCSAGYQTVITNLSDPVDVYAEWVDVVAEREKTGRAQAKEEKQEGAAREPSAGTTAGGGDDLPQFEGIYGKPQLRAINRVSDIDSMSSESEEEEAAATNRSEKKGDDNNGTRETYDGGDDDDDDDEVWAAITRPSSPRSGTIIESDESENE